MNDYEELCQLRRDKRKLEEKLRKAEARAKQAEDECQILQRESLGMQWALMLTIQADGGSKAQRLIDHLFTCHKADMATNLRLRRQKEAWTAERKKLLELCRKPCGICEHSKEQSAPGRATASKGTSAAMSSRITEGDAVNAAMTLQEFCCQNECVTCVFFEKMSFNGWETLCRLRKLPDSWELDGLTMLALTDDDKEV